MALHGTAMPRGLARNLISSHIPMVVCSSGTMGNNGAMSGIGAVGAIYPDAYVYLPANAIVAGSAAGWYYAVFSSTTAATVYNNTYSSGVPAIPASPTAFATTGPGAFTANNVGGIGTVTFTLPANTLGPNGELRVRTSASQTNNANAKSLLVRVGSDTALPLVLTSVAYLNATSIIANRGKVTAQSCYSHGNGTATYSVAPKIEAYDFGASQTITLMVTSATATDTVVLESLSVDVLP